MEISSRLFRLLKAVTDEKVNQFVDLMEQGSSVLDDVLKEWEIKHGLDQDSFAGKKSDQQTWNQTGADSNFNRQQHQREQPNSSFFSGYPKQVIEDLHLFGLKPPVTMEELKKTRNREIKKFHPDRFMNDPEKIETAKRILQIYNAAYERLKHHLK